MISDKKFLGFEWPPRMASFKPKQKKHYQHNIIVTSLHNPEVGYVLNFTSETKAKAHKKTGGEALNAVTMEYEKKEIPTTVEEGFIA